MSVHVYVDNRISLQEGLKCVPLDGDLSSLKRTFEGTNLFKDGDRLYFRLSDSLIIPIPALLKEFVEEISCHESILRMAPRESGIYRHKTAECELTPILYDGKHYYHLEIIAKTLEDIKEIIHLIKIGGIRPDESFENGQGGQTYQQLEKDYRQTLEELARMKKFFNHVCKFVGKLNLRKRKRITPAGLRFIVDGLSR